jgi:hypothetical protein
MEAKHHYRAVAKSEHLGSADLEDFIEQKRPLTFTIREVNQEYGVSVAGKKGDFNIAYFVENIKPLVLNSTNAKQIKTFCGGSPFVEDWKLVPIELYLDVNVKMKGEVVGGIRIKPIQPKTKVKLSFTEANFDKAKQANATREQIEKSYTITEEIYKKYLAHGSTAK